MKPVQIAIEVKHNITFS